jgi:hypothetical protein
LEEVQKYLLDKNEMTVSLKVALNIPRISRRYLPSEDQFATFQKKHLR